MEGEESLNRWGEQQPRRRGSWRRGGIAVLLGRGEAESRGWGSGGPGGKRVGEGRGRQK